METEWPQTPATDLLPIGWWFLSRGAFHGSLCSSLSLWPLSLLIDGFMAIIVVLMANSVLNPIIYSIRMPEIRASVLQLLFCRASNRVNQADIPIQGL